MLAFGAEWCGPAREAEHVLKHIEVIPNVLLTRVDVNDDPKRLAERLQIKILPYYVIMGPDDRIWWAGTSAYEARRMVQRPSNQIPRYAPGE